MSMISLGLSGICIGIFCNDNYRMVKNFGGKKFGKFDELQPIRQSCFANIHDEICDYTICVAECMRKITSIMKESVSF